MSELYEKSLLKLELDRVLEMLAERAGSELGKNACRNLRPTSDLEEVQALLDQTSAACDLSTKKGYPHFYDAQDVSFSLERADMGSTKRVPPEPEMSWTRPGTSFLHSLLTGTT